MYDSSLIPRNTCASDCRRERSKISFYDPMASQPGRKGLQKRGQPPDNLNHSVSDCNL